MTDYQRDILFYVFTGFFVLIGVISLSVLLGFPKGADRKLREWAVRGFVVGITTVMFGLFRLLFMSPTAPTTVVLAPPDGVSRPTLITKARYVYDDADEKTGTVVTHSGDIVPALSKGGWEVKLPRSLSDKAIRLQLEEDGGRRWRTDTFYPSYTSQQMTEDTQSRAQPGISSIPLGTALLSALETRAEAAEQTQATVRINNYARRVKELNGQTFYDWRVFVDESPEVLKGIAQVDYVLHPTFPQPFQTSKDRDARFQFSASGWGEFRILITVHYTNGKEAKTSYWLSLGKSWPAEPPPSLRVKLDTVHVEWDGSPGKAGWIFDVFLNGKLQLNLPKRDYDDGRSSGRRRPSDYVPDVGAVGTVTPQKGELVRVEVRGRRTSGSDTAIGTATVDASGGSVAMNVVNARDARKGSFVFRFSATRAGAAS